MELVKVWYLYPWSVILTSIGHAASSRGAWLCSLLAGLINILRSNIDLSMSLQQTMSLNVADFHYSYTALAK